MESSTSTTYNTITKFQRFEFFLGILNRMVIGFVTIYVTWLCMQRLKYGDVPWHALFCTIGFNCLMAEGLLSYYKGNSSIYNWFRKEKVILHIILQLLGSLLGISGIIIRMTIDKVHFKTFHGQLGLAALVLCLGSLVFGVSALYSSKMKDCLQPLFNKTIHGFLGILTYIVAIVCLICGFDTNVFGMMLPFEIMDSTIFILKLATFGCLIMTIYRPLGSVCKTIWNHHR